MSNPVSGTSSAATIAALQPPEVTKPAVARDGIGNDHTTTPDTTAPDRSLYNVDGKPDFSNNGLPSMNDVKQEGYGDCYLDATLASLAQNHPEQLKSLIHDNGNGTFTVTFPHQKDNGVGNVWGLFGDNYHDVKVTVGDGDFPSDATNSASGEAKWPEVMEAAYAKLKGGYDDIGKGGNPTDPMHALTGNDANYYSPQDGVGKIEQAVKDHKLVTVLTPDYDGGKDSGVNGPHSLVGWHCYTVTGVTTGPDGTKYAELRNPWGSNQPPRIPLDQLAHDGSISEVEIGNP